MTITVKVLADGQLSSSKATLYTVPVLTKCYIKFLSVCNVAASQQAIQIFINPNGASRKIAHLSLAENEYARVVEKDETITLEAGDTIEGQSTNGSSVDYLITGAEEA